MTYTAVLIAAFNRAAKDLSIIGVDPVDERFLRELCFGETHLGKKRTVDANEPPGPSGSDDHG
jgi:hypothetical protein